MTWPASSRAAREKFCKVEGWTPVRNARGGDVGHYVTYELALPDGRVLRTRISRPPDKSGYGDRMWGHILRDQLGVTEKEFWACVNDGAPPDRGGHEQNAEEALPVEMAFLLRRHLRLAESDIKALTPEEPSAY